jgi:Transglycosylase-like domain
LVIAIAAFASLAAASTIPGEARAEGSGGIATAAAGGGSDSASRNSAKYERLWDRVKRRDRRWARRTAKCESGRDPAAIGGGGRYRGAFQFMRSTWKSAPKSPGGDPIVYSYRTQAVVAVLLKQRDGAGHWPVCG